MNDQHMNDKEMDAVLRTWVPDAPAGHPDRSRVVGNVVRQLHSTRRRRRWWLTAAFRRTASTPMDAERHHDPATPVPATNGHIPTDIGRSQIMFSPAKAITAGALIFAIGGVLLIAQPFERPLGAPGAATDESPAAPVAVTATSYAGGCPGAETTETVGIIERTTGGYCNPTWDWSDDRLDGKVTWASNSDVYADGSGLSIGMLALSFENEDGAWRMRPLPVIEFPDASPTAADAWILDGEGAYEGLTAVLLVDYYVPHGFIIDGDLPPAPENASTK
jgi:hypothetical protein